jgi:hypothetical protein
VTYTEFRGLSREALLRIVEQFPQTQKRLRARAVWVAFTRQLLAETAAERAAGRGRLGERGRKPDFLDLVYRAVCAPHRASAETQMIARATLRVIVQSCATLLRGAALLVRSVVLRMATCAG